MTPLNTKKNKIETTTISISTRVLSKWENENIIKHLIRLTEKHMINKSKIIYNLKFEVSRFILTYFISKGKLIPLLALQANFLSLGIRVH